MAARGAADGGWVCRGSRRPAGQKTMPERTLLGQWGCLGRDADLYTSGSLGVFVVVGISCDKLAAGALLVHGIGVRQVPCCQDSWCGSVELVEWCIKCRGDDICVI